MHQIEFQDHQMLGHLRSQGLATHIVNVILLNLLVLHKLCIREASLFVSALSNKVSLCGRFQGIHSRVKLGRQHGTTVMADERGGRVGMLPFCGRGLGFSG